MAPDGDDMGGGIKKAMKRCSLQGKNPDDGFKGIKNPPTGGEENELKGRGKKRLLGLKGVPDADPVADAFGPVEGGQFEFIDDAETEAAVVKFDGGADGEGPAMEADPDIVHDVTGGLGVIITGHAQAQLGEDGIIDAIVEMEGLAGMIIVPGAGDGEGVMVAGGEVIHHFDVDPEPPFGQPAEGQDGFKGEVIPGGAGGIITVIRAGELDFEGRSDMEVTEMPGQDDGVEGDIAEAEALIVGNDQVTDLGTQIGVNQRNDEMGAPVGAEDVDFTGIDKAQGFHEDKGLGVGGAAAELVGLIEQPVILEIKPWGRESPGKEVFDAVGI